MNKPYLSAEDQYKEILNNEEIERIQDLELQGIRKNIGICGTKHFLMKLIFQTSSWVKCWMI